jgi:hypothetical protein
MVVLGIVLLLLAGIGVLAGALANSGSDHTIVDGFNILGMSVNGSSGKVFLYGAILGAVAMLGLNVLLAGLGRGLKNKVRHRKEVRNTRKREKALDKEREVHDSEAIDITRTHERDPGV